MPLSEEGSSPRSIAEVFQDLRVLTQSDGAIHSISSIIYRDWVVTVDKHEARVTDDPSYRWRSDKLNNNELMLLVGLAVQSPSDRIYSVLPRDDTFAEKADKLLRELHDRINEDVPMLDPETLAPRDPSEFVGQLAKEAIYYGADGFYIHQFRALARHRFRDDQIWLLRNVGMSIRSIIDIASFIAARITMQMDIAGHRRARGEQLSAGDLTSSLLISKADLAKKFGRKSEAFLVKFVTPGFGANAGFTDPFAVNLANIAPLIDLGEYLYVPNQYRLFQSVYESPFYWMMADAVYAPTASDHRGAYVEHTSAHILSKVFGRDHVHQNVKLYTGKNIAGEVDVLVAYGEFVIVGQAKSKRVSLKARSGDKAALINDFQGAIQAPYDQAMACAELIRGGARCVTSDGRTLEFPALPRLFPMVVLSDHFPAVTQLSGLLLKQPDRIAPVIWDLGMLDCITRVLASPIEMIFYLQCRAQLFEKVVSDSEYNFLGYHLASKLAIPDEVDMIMLDRDFAAVVDDFMIAADLGLDAKRPRGVLEQLDIPVITELVGELKSADARLAALVIDLYDFSGAALGDISATILEMRNEVRQTGKALKAFSIQTASGGLTYVVSSKRSADTARSAELIGKKHKYDCKSDRWYVVLDCVNTDLPVDGILALIWAWTEDEDEARRSEMVGTAYNSKHVAVTIGEAATRLKKSVREELSH